ncbi:MAG: GDP-L-fucose synthase [Betaproteobacteria bacterium]|nr:GDP-L-fucose synthase [Betaproteobacteria bacterium]
MQKSSKIYIAGHRGLVGSALVRALQRSGFTNLVTRTHAELDLTDLAAVRRFFDAERPEYVMLAAAKVGGILANRDQPAEFIHSNLAIQTNVIDEAYRHGVKRLLFLGSSCVYPRECPQPIKEEYLLTSPLETTNRAYALAKIAGIEMCASYNRQYGTKYLAVMPTNLYGPGDNYDLATSHVLPALIRKCHEAKAGGAKEVPLWGTGSPRREFLHSDDMAEACLFLMNLPDERFAEVAVATPGFPLVNIGVGEDLTILELANLIKDVVGFPGQFAWDPTKPDGTPRKLLSVDRINAMGWKARIGLRDGISSTYNVSPLPWEKEAKVSPLPWERGRG